MEVQQAPDISISKSKQKIVNIPEQGQIDHEVIVRLDDKIGLGAELGDPCVAKDCFVRQVPSFDNGDNGEYDNEMRRLSNLRDIEC